MAKHRETFWVKARVSGSGDNERFQYFEAIHTRAPLESNFAPLIDSGNIELDLLIHLKESPTGKIRTRDHGYLFKMAENDRSLLFSAPQTYSLLTQQRYL
jgi:hypothetical protein